MSNFIHSTALVDDDVIIGSNNYIGPFCRISGPVEMGDDNYLDSFVSIGSPPQDDMFDINLHLSYLRGFNKFAEVSPLIRIGSRNFFREFVTIHKPILSLTEIGNDCYFMTQVHIPHDALIKNRVKFANSTHLGGFSVVQSDAYLGLSSTVLQFSVIGGMSMIGMNSSVSRNIYPGSLVAGSPAKTVGPNIIKLNKYFGNSNWWVNLNDGLASELAPDDFISVIQEFEELKSFNSQRKKVFEALRSNYRTK